MLLLRKRETKRDESRPKLRDLGDDVSMDLSERRLLATASFLLSWVPVKLLHAERLTAGLFSRCVLERIGVPESVNEMLGAIKPSSGSNDFGDLALPDLTFD